ncbi:uncharacterized protein LOC103171094 [Ornithorhynchus anatinus]|uniref:uncharacterized protein LOC103171094 n=1 Tax=Ornithorhynchus anatinus TaxID=9258 RepID=UPI0010A93244|nr:uncharacterized protein LOC103171094 [Ornithorhynchus anatinus]
MSSPEGFAAVFYSEPSVLGFLANVISALLVCLQNFFWAHTSIRPQGIENILAGVHLILIGGFSQLLAGFLSFRKYDHLGGTAFLAFAGLWSSYGATRIISGAYSPQTNLNVSDAALHRSMSTAIPTIREGTLPGMVAYIFISFILAFCSATVNYVMPFIFGAITLTLVFETVGLFGVWALVVSGVLELVIVVCGLYGAIALLFKGITQRFVLPGFGNPLFNILLLGSANRTSSKNIGEEKKKNTKYAEPMALSNLCDTVSPFVFAFFCFGYSDTFYLGAVWITINSFGQLLSSYYGYLRDDAYYTTKFGVHSLYWLVQSWEQFTLTVFIRSQDVQGSREGMFGDWFFLIVACILSVASFNKDVLEVIQNGLFVLLTISTLHQIPIKGGYVFFGVACCLFLATSLYATFARLINSIGEKALVPVGPQLVSTVTLEKFLGFLKSRLTGAQEFSDTTSCQVSEALFYVCNGLAALSAIQGSLNDPIRHHLGIPAVLIPGAIMQLYVARIQVQKGRRFGAVLPFCYAAIWATWTWLRFAGHLLNISPKSDGGFTAGAVAFLVVNVFLILLASQSNLVLLFLTLNMEILIVCFLLFTLERLPLPLEIVMLALFCAICVYGTLASLVNCAFDRDLLLMGPSLFLGEKQKEETRLSPPCLCPLSHRTSSLRIIAKLLDDGGVCGVPTDTVYALAASCKHSEAIEKIYKIKDRPQDKPICIFISNLDQLRAANPPFTPLLWDFMARVYPGSIGCIVKKGEWVKKLGVGAGFDRVGTKDSIMIRVPDQTVMVHLVEMTGPLAITSANPSGESDSTHHEMVISRLGHKLEGVLCDGESDEVLASTVVNCLRIEEGTITILREGCVSAAKVMQIFEQAKSRAV